MARKATAIDLDRALPSPPANGQLSTVSHFSSPQHQDPPSRDKYHNLMRPLQHTSSKQQLQSITHKLLTLEGPPHRAWTHSDLDSVDPVKFSPPESSRAMPTMPGW